MEALQYLQKSWKEFVQLQQIMDNNKIVARENSANLERSKIAFAASISLYSHLIPELESNLFISSEKIAAQQILQQFIALKDVLQNVQELEENDSLQQINIQKAIYALISISLHLGKMQKDPSKLKHFMESNQIVHACFETVLLCMSCSSEIVQNFGIYIFREATKCSCDEEAMKDLVQSMLLFLDDSKDSASKAIVSFLADYISKDTSFFPYLFERADQTENQPLRHNALAILTEIFKIQANVQDKNLQHLLASFLLARLHDEDLALRMNAVELFKRVEMEHIIPKLVSLEMHRNDTVRAAAHKSLLKILEYHTESPRVILLLIDAVRFVEYYSF